MAYQLSANQEDWVTLQNTFRPDYTEANNDAGQAINKRYRHRGGDLLPPIQSRSHFPNSDYWLISGCTTSICMRNLIVKHVFGVACLAVLTGCQQAPQLVDYPVLRVDVRQKVIASASLVIVGTLGRDEAVGGNHPFTLGSETALTAS